jgi:two-component system response regulator HupR/HoxA
VTVALEDFSQLEVVQSLSNHLLETYGLGVMTVDESGHTHPLAQSSSLRAMAELIEDNESLISDHQLASLGWWRCGPTEIAIHPIGFQMVVGQFPAKIPLGCLAVGPFLTKDYNARGSRQIRNSLRDISGTQENIETLTTGLPTLSQTELATISQLLELMTNEAARQLGRLAPASNAGTKTKKKKSAKNKFRRLIGTSPPMLELFSLLERIVASESTVYIYGENGTGKELVAREIHEHSNRIGQSFVVQNCSALNDNLLESELFGHKRGAFTGAIADKPGLFEIADTGTLFLDEIGDMSPALQVKLLRVLQEGTFNAVGDVDVRKVDVRIVCATNRDLKQMVRDGTFREDLFYRINVISLKVPPLRERPSDIKALTDYFLIRGLDNAPGPGGRKHLSQSALDYLMAYDWPGNVRELQNEIERLLVLTGSMVMVIGPELLSPHIRQRAIAEPGSIRPDLNLSLPEALEHMERAMIYEHLKRSGWNKTKAATSLGISRRNLIRKVVKYDLDRGRSS